MKCIEDPPQQENIQFDEEQSEQIFDETCTAFHDVQPYLVKDEKGSWSNEEALAMSCMIHLMSQKSHSLRPNQWSFLCHSS